jgi:VanZ family protein
MAVIFVFSAQPDLNSGLGLIDTIGRKLIHAAEYGLLCFLWWRALHLHVGSGRRALVVAVAISSLYAVSDEYHQTFVDGRHGSPVDWGIDTMGAALSALVIHRRTT